MLRRTSGLLGILFGLSACEAAPASDPTPATSAPPAVAASASASPVAAVGEDARLDFAREGKPVAALTLKAILARIPAEEWTQLDPYYEKKKRFRAVPLAPLLRLAFGDDPKLVEADFVLEALDGYRVPLPGSRVFEPGAYVAIADLDVPGWEPIGPQRANPGPFYLVWKNDDQQSLETHPRPWQLASISIAPFESMFPHTLPRGEAEGSPAMLGFRLFRQQCVACHAINREGGNVGPDLNVPQSIVEYRPEAQIKAYIKDPLTFRHGRMPAHPHLTEADLTNLLGYFRAMSKQKHDPSAAKGR